MSALSLGLETEFRLVNAVVGRLATRIMRLNNLNASFLCRATFTG
jgi:hypothetical protein